MNNPVDVLKAAIEAPRRDDVLSRHAETITVLQAKGFSFRHIAEFLTARGVLSERGMPIDHTRVFRFVNAKKTDEVELEVPTAATYALALQSIGITEKQRTMLGKHYLAHNRTITYTELAEAAGSPRHQTANMLYGKLGRKLGEAIEGFRFAQAEVRDDPFYSSSIGMGMAGALKGKEFRLVMHHELAMAIEILGWFK